jgi:hypothetical protein
MGLLKTVLPDVATICFRINLTTYVIMLHTTMSGRLSFRMGPTCLPPRRVQPAPRASYVLPRAPRRVPPARTSAARHGRAPICLLRPLSRSVPPMSFAPATSGHSVASNFASASSSASTSLLQLYVSCVSFVCFMCFICMFYLFSSRCCKRI